ncbi:MAG: sigma-70 family RNA polymerase sigma factor [Coleofasciculaceae cyanobacterium SM2_3_26]|nr:sigma-70 family RNA polymerase sigma factor [Coleofasciculaceae cyanobacterium SM2_3_26]
MDVERSETQHGGSADAEPSNTEPSNTELSNTELSNTELWMALKQGNMDALGVLYDRHAGLVYAIALKTTKNTQDAEDLTQDIFLRLAQSSYDPKRGSLRTFLAILARSRSLDWLRSRQRKQAALQISGLEPQESTNLPVELLYKEERDREVQDALAQLSENQQRVLHLAYRDGLSQAAIAEQLGAPLGTVKAWARRGLMKLRQNLQDVLGDE